MTREEAIKILWRYDVNFEPHPAEEVMHAIDMAIEALKAQENMIPLDGEDIMFVTAEEYKAQEIVRCKDCINQSICAKTINMQRTEPNSITMWAQPVDYCSHGRRKEQNMELQDIKTHGKHTETHECVRPTQQWIPCNERLPEKRGLYLCNVLIDEKDTMIEILTYGKPLLPMNCGSGVGWYYSDSEGDYYWDEITAWMPLPTPYKGGDDE